MIEYPLRGAERIGRYIYMSKHTFLKWKDVYHIPYYMSRGVYYAYQGDLNKWLEESGWRYKGAWHNA